MPTDDPLTTLLRAEFCRYQRAALDAKDRVEDLDRALRLLQLSEVLRGTGNVTLILGPDTGDASWSTLVCRLDTAKTRRLLADLFRADAEAMAAGTWEP